MNKHDYRLFNEMQSRYEKRLKKNNQLIEKTINNYETHIAELEKAIEDQNAKLMEIMGSTQVKQVGYMSHIGNVEENEE